MDQAGHNRTGDVPSQPVVPSAYPHALERRVLGSLASSFEGWPPQADPQALAIHQKRAADRFNPDSNYFG